MTQTPISRAAWGARYRDGFDDRPMPVSEWWLHHSVTIAPDLVAPFSDDDAAVRTLERIGQERFGGGISYTYPVTPVGRIYVGHSLRRRGAHTKGHNTVGAAFVLVGDYSKRAPTAAQELAIARRMVLDHRAGKATNHQLIGGHRDVGLREQGRMTTECPGNAAYARIPAINKLARDLWASNYPTQEDDDMPTTDEIADEIWTRPVVDHTGDRVPIGVYLGETLRQVHVVAADARAAATDAAVARKLAEAAALVPGALTPGDVERITSETVAAVDAHLDARDRALAEALAAAGDDSVPA